MSSWPFFNDEKYKEVIEFYDARIQRDIVPFIKENLFRPAWKNERHNFLDIGPGSAALTKELAPLFTSTDVIEPNKDQRKNFTGFNARYACFENAEMERDKYDLILCSHVYYHIPADLWKKCLLKTFDALKTNGNMVLAIAAPRGEWNEHHNRVESKKEKRDSKMLIDALNQADLSFKTFPAKVYITARVDELEKFLDMIRLFTANSTSCQERGQTEWERVESMIDEYVKKCYDPIKHQYVLVQEEDYIVVTKP